MSCEASSAGSETSDDAIMVDTAAPSFEPEGEPSMTEVLETVLRCPKGRPVDHRSCARMALEGQKYCSKRLTELTDAHCKQRCRHQLRGILGWWRKISVAERRGREREQETCRSVWEAWAQITRDPQAALRGMRQELTDMRRESQALEARLAWRSKIGAGSAVALLCSLVYLQRLKAGRRSRQDKLRDKLCQASGRLDELEKCIRSRDQKLQGCVEGLRQKTENDKRSLYQFIETSDTKHTNALSSMSQELKDLVGAKDTEHVNALGTLRQELTNLIKEENIEHANEIGGLRHGVKDAMVDLVQAVNRRFWHRIRVPAISRL